MSVSNEGKDKPTSERESNIRPIAGSGLTWRILLLTLVLGTVFSIGSVYTLVVLSFSMGVAGTASMVFASTASIYAISSSSKKKVMPVNAHELVCMNWLGNAFTQSTGTTIVMGGVLLMRYILPSTSLAGWQRWWFAPPESELGNVLAWMPTILFWTMMVLIGRIAVIGIGLRLKRHYIDTAELPFPVAEAQADVIKELTVQGDSVSPKLRFFPVGVLLAIIFSLVFEHSWDYPLVLPLLSTAAAIVLLLGAMSNAFPWKLGKGLPKGLNKVAYYFSYFFFFIGILGLISCVYAPVDSLLYYLRFGFNPVPAPRLVDLSSLVPPLSGFGFGVAVSVFLFAIGYLIPSDSSSGILFGSLIAFVLIPLGFVGLTGSVNQTLILNIDLSLTLAALFCATIVGSVVATTRTVLANRTGAKLVILGGLREIYTPNRVKRSRIKKVGFQRLGESAWGPFFLTWIPLTVSALIMISLIGTEPGMPSFFPAIVVLSAFIITPIATTTATWIASRTTRVTSQVPLPFLYEGILYGTGVKQLSPYSFGPPVAGQAQGILSQLRVVHLTQTRSRGVYLADLIGFPILGVLISSLICIWVFGSIGAPSSQIALPGVGPSAVLEQWNFAPVWNALYTFFVILAQGGGTFPYQCDPFLFFLLPLILLSAWTVLLGFKRIPIASIAGIIVGFAVLPYMAITISIGAIAAIVIRKIKGVEWFARYGTILGAGIYAGASISLLFLVIAAPLIP